MKREEFYRLIDEIIEAEPGTIKGTELLSDIAAWDSLAAVGFIASMDRNLNSSISVVGLMEAKSIEDLLHLVAEKISQ